MVSHDAGVLALPGISSGQKGFVAILAVVALLALAYAYVLVREVLKADQGTEGMQSISKAVQEGAAAYLNRQFRTLAVFAAIVFVLLFLLPVNEGGASVRIGRAIFFLVGAAFSATVGYIGMTMATRANVRVAAAARGGTRRAGLPHRLPHRRHRRHAHRRPRPARCQHRAADLQRTTPRSFSRASASAAPCSPCSCVSAAASSPRPPTSVPTWSARSRRASPRTTRATPPPSPTTSATTSATAPAWRPTCSSPTR